MKTTPNTESHQAVSDRLLAWCTFLIVVAIMAAIFFIGWLHWDIRHNVRRNTERLDQIDDHLYRHINRQSPP